MDDITDEIRVSITLDKDLLEFSRLLAREEKRTLSNYLSVFLSGALLDKKLALSGKG